MPVRFYEQHVTSKLGSRRKLSAFLQQLIRKWLKEVKTIDLTYVFCNDALLLEMNQEFLGHETLTDILTFDMSEKKSMLQGEVYISVERVEENARDFEVNYEQELHRVIFHGALHLCGFKDKTKAEAIRMRQEEENCLQAYFDQ